MTKVLTSRRASAASFLFWITLTYCFAAVGAVAASQAGSFYAQLSRPSWAPPAWLFGPVWGILYLLMALAAWRIWQSKSHRTSTSASAAIILYLVQLGLNALWTWLFFAWHRGLLHL
jgi:tryptophan-rich sensory protein